MSYLQKEHENVITCLETFGCLTLEQVKQIVSKSAPHLNENKIDGTINKLKATQQIHISENNKFVALNPMELQTPKQTTIAAFWLFLDFYNAANGCFSKANYPGEIVFIADSKVYRIVIMADPNCAELSLLKASQQIDGITDFIVSLHTDFDKVNQSLFPDKDFYFVRAIRKADVFDAPDFEIISVKSSDEDEDEE